MMTNLVQFLTTPNEVLHYIFLCILSFIETIFEFTLFTKLLNISSTKKQKYLYITLSTICYILTNLIFKSPYIINLIIIFLLIFCILKQTIKNTFIALVTMYLITFISTCLTEIFFESNI